MSEQKRIPQNENTLNKAYLHCLRKKTFREIEKEDFSEYLERAQKDLISAERDFIGKDFHWARIKAYQSLFYLLNALLIKKEGYFSKDHSCIITALMYKEIITEEIAKKLHLVTDKIIANKKSKDIYQDIDDFRIQRNFALYKPKAWEDITEEDIKNELEKIKENFKILVGLL